MCRGSVFKKMLLFAIPLMCSSILQLLFNAADIVVVGRFAGDNALAAVGSNSALINLLTNLFVGLSIGSNVLTAQYYGAKKDTDLKETVHTSMLISIYSGLILTVIGILGARVLLEMMQAPPEVLDLAVLYLRIYFVGMTSTMVYNFGSAILRAVGDTKRPLYYLLGAGIINVILNLIFVIFLHMGVAGVALATVISQFVSAVWVLRFLTRKERAMGIRRKYLKIRGKIVAKIMSLGVAPFIMQATESFISIVMNSGLQRYGGDMYVGTLTIMQSVMQFVSIPVSGFTQGVQPIMSYNFGAGNTERVKKTYFTMLGIVMSYTILLTISIMAIPGVFARMFTDSSELILLVEKIMPVFVCGMLVFGVQMSSQTTFLALGQAKISLFIALLRKVILLIPLAIILPKLTGDVMFIYYAEPISGVTSALTCGILFACLFGKILKRSKA